MDRFTKFSMDFNRNLAPITEDVGIFHDPLPFDTTVLTNREHNVYFTGEIVDRLAAYEDTGLTPDEINEMKARGSQR